MQSSLIKFLFLISSLVVGMGCQAPQQLQPLSKGQHQQLTKDNFKPIFKDNFKSFLFKTTLTYGKKFELGGLLMLKQLSADNYRTILMTKFGMTLFDFEFGKNGFVVHKVLKEMDRPSFLKIIKEDLEMLLMQNLLGQKATFFVRDKTEVIKTKLNKKTHFFVQEKIGKITQIHQQKNVSIQLSKYIARIPRSIKIEHHNMPLSMKLTLLKH